jgi:hypothetical protein
MRHQYYIMRSNVFTEIQDVTNIMYQSDYNQHISMHVQSTLKCTLV